MARRDVVAATGAGARLRTVDGQEYIDLAGANGWAVLGHSHPAVTRAIAEQAGRLVMYTENGFNDQRALWFDELARLLAETLGASERGPLSRIHPCNSGTEAVEGAIKAARYFTGRPGIVAARRGFHGRTLGSLSATWKAHYRDPFGPLVPGFGHVSFNDPAGLDGAIDDKTAALLIEVVQGEGGVHPATPEFLHRARELCRDRGALLAVDEVQTGFGRTGRWFACEHWQVEPDILVLGKALGGGIPMGATVWREGLGRYETGRHASTFGGNPLACAASRAVLHTLGEGEPARPVPPPGGGDHRSAGPGGTAPWSGRSGGWVSWWASRSSGRSNPTSAASWTRASGPCRRATTCSVFSPPLVIDEDDLATGLDRIVQVLRDG